MSGKFYDVSFIPMISIWGQIKYDKRQKYIDISNNILCAIHRDSSPMSNPPANQISFGTCQGRKLIAVYSNGGIQIDKRKIIVSAILSIFVIFILFAYFRPRPLEEILKLSDMDPKGTAYCTFFDVSEGVEKSWFGSANELTQPSNDFLLFHQVYAIGPIFYKNSSVNADISSFVFLAPPASRRIPADHHRNDSIA